MLRQNPLAMLFQWALGEGHLVFPVTEEEKVTTPDGGVRGRGGGSPWAGNNQEENGKWSRLTCARFSCCVSIECLQAAEFFWVLGEKLSILVTVAPVIIMLIIVIPFMRLSHVSAYAVAGMTLGNQ